MGRMERTGRVKATVVLFRAAADGSFDACGAWGAGGGLGWKQARK